MYDFETSESLKNNKAELYLYGEIVSEEPWHTDDYINYRKFISELKNLGEYDNIDVFINSSGGDVFAAKAIYSQLKNHKANINIIIEGICASAATIVAMAGNKISMTSGSLFMIHNPSIGIAGFFQSEKLEIFKNQLEKIKTSIIDVYKTKIFKTDEELSEIMDNETWYTTNEALETGIINEIINSENNCFIDDKGNIFINNIAFNTKRFKNFPKEKFNLYKNKAEKLFFNTKNNKNREDLFMNVSELEQKYPELVQNIRDSAKKEAVLKERERLKAIDEISDCLPAQMVQKAKYSDCITAEKLAFEAMREDKVQANSIFRDMISDNKESNVKTVSAVGENVSVSEEKKNRLSRVVDFMNKDKRRLHNE